VEEKGKKLRVLVTRPKEDSAALQQELRKRGIEVLLDPMLVIQRMEDAAIDLEGAQGLLFTSSNGIRAFEKLSAERGLPAWCVGDETARTARAADFTDVRSAAGDVDALANDVIAHSQPVNGRMVHIAGSVSAGDLAGALRAAGFSVDRIPLYEAVPATLLGEDTKRPHCSPRSTKDRTVAYERTEMTSEAETPNGKPSIPDGEIIERFGGIRPMASKLGVAVTTVQGWKERGHIPEGRLPQIIAAAAELGVDIGLKKVLAPEPEPKPEPTPAEEIKPVAAAVAAPARPAGGVSWLALAVVIVLLGGAILTRPLWESKLYPGIGDGSGSVDTGRLDEIAAGLAAIEAAMKDLGRELDAGERELSDRIDALEAGGGETGAAFAEQLAVIEQGMSDLADKLGTGLSGIESRIARLEASEGELPEGVKASLQAADAALDGLRGEVGELGQAARALQDGVASIGGNIGDLEGRVTALETRPLQTGEKIAAMVLALGQVEAAMEVLGRDDPVILEGGAVAALSPWADYGIPDRLALRGDFARLAPDIDRALSGAEGGSWLDDVWNSVTGLVTIRRIDGSDLNPIGKAERALDDGNLEAAAAAFDGKGSLGLDGDAWLNSVKARIDAEQEIDTLYGQIIAPLAGARGGDGAAAQ
jgi:hypothetical protein